MRPEFDSKLQKALEKPDYVKTSKYFSVGSVIFIGIGILSYAIVCGLAMD